MTIKNIAKQYRLLGWAIATLCIFLLPGVGQLASLIFISDKEAHFFFFLSISLFLTSKGISFRYTMYYIVVISIFIESLQGLIPTRSFDFEDMFVNLIGASLGLLFRFGFNQLLLALALPYKLIVTTTMRTYEFISLDSSNRLLFYWYYALYSTEDFFKNRSSFFPESSSVSVSKRYF
ncbi:MAG: VanZ family protein [Spirosomataceae bacterium]